VHLREVSAPTRGQCTYARSVHLREVSAPTRGQCTYARSVHLPHVLSTVLARQADDALDVCLVLACIIRIRFYGHLNLRRALFSPTTSQFPYGPSSDRNCRQ